MLDEITAFFDFISKTLSKDITIKFVSNLVFNFSLIIFFLLRDHFFKFLILLKNYGYYLITRKKYILLWNDVDIAVSEQLAGILQRRIKTSQLKVIKSPKEILNYIVLPKVVHGIIFIITDVTKISDNHKEREKLQQAILKYVKAGGGFIGTHDITYKRVRNNILYKVFGCQTKHFLRIEKPVEYIKNKLWADHPICKDMPDKFELSDEEIVWGDWAPDTMPLYLSNNKTPLVVAREYAKGRVVWLNSGDRIEHIARSIALPEENFVKLLSNSLRWVGQEDREETINESSNNNST